MPRSSAQLTARGGDKRSRDEIAELSGLSEMLRGDSVPRVGRGADRRSRARLSADAAALRGAQLRGRNRAPEVSSFGAR